MNFCLLKRFKCSSLRSSYWMRLFRWFPHTVTRSLAPYLKEANWCHWSYRLDICSCCRCDSSFWHRPIFQRGASACVILSCGDEVVHLSSTASSQRKRLVVQCSDEQRGWLMDGHYKAIHTFIRAPDSKSTFIGLSCISVSNREYCPKSA